MNQFDVFVNPDVIDRETKPYLVVLQHDHLYLLPTVVAAPLVPISAMTGIPRLSPQVDLGSERFWLHIHDLGTFSRSYFGSPAVATLKARRDAIVAATDLLFTGV